MWRFQQEIDVWRASREQIAQHYNPTASKNEHFRVQEAESVQLLYEFLHQPESYMQHPMRYATSILTCLNYGIRCEAYEDPALHNLEDIVAHLRELFTPGAKSLADDFPWLGYLPDFLSPWRAKAKHVGEMAEGLYEDLADIAWDRGVSGQNANTLGFKFRLGEHASGLTRRQQAFTCGAVLEEGSDTVAGTILTCILALIHDPESQKHARGEIDSLYGEDALPGWNDEQSTPLVRAVVKEVLRWRPPKPIGIPYKLEQGKQVADTDL
ncbi:hypothetical protein FRC08_012836 [Ceratobasidium sp. 394]|nr:hypothetical protein FRC08_012836 [Ceratobasidium sp. 394]